MRPNQKLTNLIKGRKVVGSANDAGKTIVTFDDGSTMRIKTGDNLTAAAAARAINDTTSTRGVELSMEEEDLTNLPTHPLTDPLVEFSTRSETQSQDFRPDPKSKRNDVYRNVKWSEDAFKADVSRHSDNDSTSNVTNAANNAANDDAKSVASSPLDTIHNVAPISPNSASPNPVSRDIASSGGTVISVRQNDSTLSLEFEDGSKMDIPLQEASSSVMLRAQDNTMEYAD